MSYRETNPVMSIIFLGCDVVYSGRKPLKFRTASIFRVEDVAVCFLRVCCLAQSSAVKTDVV
jgi:hypothetical protein